MVAQPWDTKITTIRGPDHKHPHGLDVNMGNRYYTDPHKCRTMDSNMDLGSRTGTDAILALATSRPPTSTPSSLHSLHQHMNHSASLSLPLLHHILAHHNDTHLPSATRCQFGLWMLQAGQAIITTF